MAMRWLPMVLASYKQAAVTDGIIFTDGDGNFYAEGYLDSAFCRDEAAEPISEKQDITPNYTHFPANALPIWDLESIEFTFPITVAQFQQLKANPNGKIYYEGDGKSGYGWISTVDYKPEAGSADFTLIPER